MRFWTSLVTSVVLTAAVAHAASFYGAIRIEGFGVALSTGQVDFLNPAGPPNGQAIVSRVNPGPGPDAGPAVGSTVLVKDFTPGSAVTNFLTFDGWSGPFSNGTSEPGASSFFYSYGYILLGPPLFDPRGCVADGLPFCVSDEGGISIAFFSLWGASSGQGGYWQASFAAILPMSADTARSMLQSGQTIVSDYWVADAFAAPEPATSTTFGISFFLLILGMRRFSRSGGRS